ncbi:hypothetical protein MJ874_16450 [Lactiplantibacillus plantarum]|nr:hypothetical protein [Lactiplantibacillus plantarum]
MYRGLDCINC